MIEIRKAWSNSWGKIADLNSIYKLYGVKNVIWCFNRLLKDENLEKVLDVGCGAGFYFKYFYENGSKEMHGLEYDKKNVQKAIELNRNLNVNIIQGDINEISKNYQKSYFDVIICLGLIEHFKHPIEQIKKLLNLVKTKGVLLLEMPNFNNRFYYKNRLKRISSLVFHNWWGIKEWYHYLTKIKGCYLEKIQTGDIWSNFGYLHWNLSKISEKLVDLEISIENRIFPRSGSLAFYKLRKIN